MINKNNQPAMAISREEEYKIISKDLHLVLWLNLSYLVAILAIYFTDQRYHYLMKIFSKFLK